MSPIEAYLSRIERELRALPAPLRANEVREIRAHLEQLVEDGVALGQPRDAAVQAAVAQFGDARAVGIKMRDVWEGQDFGWKRVVTAFFFGLVPFLMYWSALKGVALFQSWPESAFFTTSWQIPIPFTSGSQSIDFFFALFLLLPAMTSVIHAYFLGRRAWMMSAAIYGYGLCWSALTVLMHPPALLSGVSPLLIVAFSTAIPAWSLFWGVLVADVTARWLRRRRHQQLVLAASDSMGSVTALKRVKNPVKHWKPKVLLAWLFVGIAAVGGLHAFDTVQKRLDLAHHPQNASEAVRTKLLLSRDATKVTAPDTVALGERPPSRAERAAGTRVVYFKVDYQLKPESQQRYISYLKSQLATASGRKRWGDKKLRDSLSEVSGNRFSFSDTAIVRKTSEGWQVDEKRVPWMSFGASKTFDWSRIQTWLRDIPFED